MRIGIAGIGGRMGQMLAEAVQASPAKLVGGTLRPGSTGTSLPPPLAHVPVLPDIESLAGECDAVIDFTHASVVQAHAGVMEATATAWVLGTSGLSAEDEAAVLRASGQAPVVYAPNYAPGVTLLLAAAERLAAALPAADYDAEIVEMHHRHKRDAPSGTALGLGRAVAAGRGVDLADVMESGRHGEPGPRRPGAIGFAALRGGQVVGDHELIFASDAEQIVLGHRAFDRRVFAAGALRAALWLDGRQPGLFSMKDVLGLA